jgi:hypothetical protein
MIPGDPACRLSSPDVRIFWMAETRLNDFTADRPDYNLYASASGRIVVRGPALPRPHCDQISASVE